MHKYKLFKNNFYNNLSYLIVSTYYKQNFKF